MVRYPLSLLAGLGITVAMLWLIWGLTSYQPRDRQLPQRVTRLAIAPAMPAAETPEPQRPPTELPAPPPVPEEPPPPPDPLEPPPTDPIRPIEPLLPEPDLSPALELDLPGRPLIGPKPRPHRKPTRRPSRVVSPSPPVTSPPISHQASAKRQPAVSDRQPAILANPRPTYPRRARRRHQEGAVKLRFTVTTSGRVRDIEVVWSRPAGVFDREAKRALARWRFKPALTNGKPTSARVSQVISFKLER